MSDKPANGMRAGPDGAPLATREGDPLHGLWHWTDHPMARVGIAVAIMAACLIIFPLLAQVTF